MNEIDKRQTYQNKSSAQPNITVSSSFPTSSSTLNNEYINEWQHNTVDLYNNNDKHIVSNNHNYSEESCDEDEVPWKMSSEMYCSKAHNDCSSDFVKQLWKLSKQPSLSSVSSLDTSYTSDLSDFDESFLSVQDTTPKKESMWVTVRKMIRWQPFMQNYKREYPWIQLAGHAGGFKSGNNGTVLKKTSKKEVDCLQKLMQDPLKSYVPEFKQEFLEDGEQYIQMQDLLEEFHSPSFVMDCKMGIRTYLEDEVNKSGKPRKDLYEKMISVDPNEPTGQENNICGCTKSRYMQWREQLSSTANLGFRIEGLKRGENPPDKDFKRIKTEEDISRIFLRFIENKTELQERYLKRLQEIEDTLFISTFFRTHEVIGSSLLFVHDTNGKCGIWLIDFGKTTPLTNGHTINHKSPWVLGNHEDGYLIGLNSIISIWKNLFTQKSSTKNETT